MRTCDAQLRPLARGLLGASRNWQGEETGADEIGPTTGRVMPDPEESIMGRGILLWLLGVPIPVILLLALCSHH